MLQHYHDVAWGATGFHVFPAIDLRGGRVVRLRRGDFDQETTYGDDPVATAVGFAEAGARWLHIVDLDGARAGEPVQTDIVAAVTASLPHGVATQVAGGLRTAVAIDHAFAAGASRVVLGTAALRDPSFAAEAVGRHGSDRVAVALDVRDGLAVGEGWRDGADGVDAAVALCRLADLGVTLFAATAIDRDGVLAGPDLALLRRLVDLDRGGIIASAGISSVGDLLAARAIGCVGGIVGRALYEGRLDLREALATLDGPAPRDPTALPRPDEPA